MKSIMEEAKSIAKAIENGWARAGKPQEFTVKVYEEPQTNFIGFTTKPAKIGLFFQEYTVAQSSRPQQKERPHTQSQPQPRKAAHQEPQVRPVSSRAQQQAQVQAQPEISQPKREHTTTSPWNPELVASSQEWVKESLSLLADNNVTFTVEVDRYALKLNFNKLITQNDEKEKMLFRGWAYLIMQALRQKYKRPLKGLKVILMSNA
ncbi:MAG: hypothetical protein P4L31_03575 [Candidatus Babeliales bacterium]|nr:hypothetical protein [Candidatus Babeliales bacterium]